MIAIREAASFEGLIILAVIYFVFGQVRKAGRQAGRGSTEAADRSPGMTGSTPSPPERTSLESIIKEIERVKQQGEAQRVGQGKRSTPVVSSASPAMRRSPPRPEVVQDERGPLGRMSDIPLPSAEELEDRTSLAELRARGKAESLQMSAAERQRRQRQVVDTDAEGEAVAARRLREVEVRNRPHQMADHEAFDQRVRAPSVGGDTGAGSPNERLRQAVIWREILGPPKAFDD